MTETSKKWLEAAKVLSNDPKAIVSCPVCGQGKLIVKDERFGDKQIDRYLICDTCNKYEVLTFSLD